MEWTKRALCAVRGLHPVVQAFIGVVVLGGVLWVVTAGGTEGDETAATDAQAVSETASTTGDSANGESATTSTVAPTTTSSDGDTDETPTTTIAKTTTTASATTTTTTAADTTTTTQAPTTTTAATTTTTAATPPQGGSITIKDFAFSGPGSVGPGGLVTVSNEDGATHNVTSSEPGFASGDISGGGSGSFTAPTDPGTYGFTCTIHASMSGSLTVSG